ncbi:hypothetical protein GCM10009837_06620 [Streptomyces durmitorensis]|uniref:Uncharacterized protein n=1 Tax=Streptomyces durmitorensis TaxID=319947 RepID=A0ABY4PM10_9ACTN|nr:hypothetical protein [Streptomyces durmitorensis]UQT54442.1 hypothetical protein M4V62_04670 [Streptomyces durmitorensis]
MSDRLSPQREAVAVDPAKSFHGASREELVRLVREECARADANGQRADRLETRLGEVRAERDEALAETSRLSGLLGARDAELEPLRERAAAAGEYYRTIGVQGEEIAQLRVERGELKQRVARAIYALKSPAPSGSEHYRSGWDDGLEASIDAARTALDEAGGPR